MKVKSQRNAYYVDITKNVYCGYVESAMVRTTAERRIEYRCHHLDIEDAVVMEDSEALPSSGSTSVKLESVPVSQEDTCRSALPAHGLRVSYRSDDKTATLTVELPESFDRLEFILRITFRPALGNPDVVWYTPVDQNDKHKELVVRGPAPHDPACWSSAVAPFINAITPFELIYAIPNKDEVRVASSGTFHAIKEEARNVIYSYRVTAHPANLMFAIGTYDQVDVFADSDMRRILAPAWLPDLSDVQSDLQSIIRFIESFAKTDALRSLSVIFTMTDPLAVSSALDLVVIGAACVDGPAGVEPVYRLKRTLCDALSHNVFGFLGWDLLDSWIPVGMDGYLSDHAVRCLLGNNEFLCSYKEDKDYVIQNDVLEPPLFYTQRRAPEYHSTFFRAKSRLVFHCLESHLSIAFLQKIADEVIAAKQNVFGLGVAPKGGPACLPFTARFLKIIKNATGKDLGSFFDMYVFLPGLLRVKLALQINKKKNLVRVVPSVQPTSLLQGCNKKYGGPVLLKTSEIEGSYDHDILLDAESTFVYHTRTKKKKKEDEEEVMPLLFVRVDPKREFLFDFAVEQPDYMYMEQLSEKNVVGQLEAITALQNKATVATCEALERVLDNSHVFYRIRVKILYALRSISIEGYSGLQRLIQYFVRTRCVPNSTILKGNEFRLVNYFLQKHLVKAIAAIDSIDGLVGGAGAHGGDGQGTVRERAVGDCRIIIAFLETTLKFNDNSLSSFDDSWYIASVINSLSVQVVLLRRCGGLDKATIDHCVDEIERLRILDMVFPSNNNIISRSCFISFIRLGYHGLARLNEAALVSLSKYPNLPSIRLVAIEGRIVIFGARVADILALVRSDTCYFIHQVLKIILGLLKLGTYRMPPEGGTEAATVAALSEMGALYRGRILLCNTIEEIILFIRSKHVRSGEYSALVLRSFNFAKEEMSRSTLLSMVNRNKGIRMAGLYELRCSLLAAEGIVRIPKYPKKLARVVSKPVLKIRLPISRYVPKNVGGVIFRFKAPKTPIVYRRSDIPTLLVTKILEHHNSGYLDEFLKKSRKTGFFKWMPMTLKRIFEACIGNGYTAWDGDFSERLLPSEDAAGFGPDGAKRANNTRSVYERIEGSLIYVLSYATFKGKMYFAAKIVLNLLEKLVYQHSYI